MSSSRNLVLKAETLPRIGDTVVDENLKDVGAVLDVIGLVSSPYVTVRPASPEPLRLVKSMLYTVPSTGRKEKRKYGR
ncbi:MAG: Gar1/Naf1 family protein [Candidatus Bathyarchaeia archaeon]